jgi:lysylphosphatidylglycerol synthetase-like protein (DUF2156 family)
MRKVDGMGSTQTSTELDHDMAADVLRRCSDHPSAFLTLNQGNVFYTSPGILGFVCYRPVGRYWIQFGGPFAAPGDRAGLLARFLAEARRQRRRVLAVQVQRADAELYVNIGMRVDQAGASYAVPLAGMTLAGKKFVRLRNKISRARRAGLQITEVDAAEHAGQIAEIDRRWLRDKGRHVKKLEFLVGEIGGPAQSYRRLFLGTIAGEPTAYLSFAPVYGQHAGWLHDLSRRIPEAPPGVMEAITVQAIGEFRTMGAEWLHFGFTPFTGLDAACELATASRPVSRIVRILADKGDVIYPSKTQLDYKMKWDPTAIFPEYIAYDRWLSPRAIWSLIRVTNSI